MEGNTTSYDSEAAHLCDIYDDNTSYGEYDSYGDFLELRCADIAHDEWQYLKNRKAKVGEKIECAGPLCKKKFIKKSYQQCFCCTKHKDQFWNRREAHFGYRKPIEK